MAVVGALGRHLVGTWSALGRHGKVSSEAVTAWHGKVSSEAGTAWHGKVSSEAGFSSQSRHRVFLRASNGGGGGGVCVCVCVYVCVCVCVYVVVVAAVMALVPRLHAKSKSSADSFGYTLTEQHGWRV